MRGTNKLEKKLVENILNGNVKLFEELILQYQKLVISIVMHFTNSQYDLEEVCQEIFIKIYQSLSQFQFKSKLSTWIGKITYNHCVNYVKKKSKYLNTCLMNECGETEISEFFIDDRSVDFETKLENHDINHVIQNKINQLPELYRTILKLFHMQEMSYTQISEIMDLPEGTVKSYLFRARKLLKEKLLSTFKVEEFI